ncbi:unnamed protein product [Tenebrio molitor]|nr:unnamed protein product [Tenebrio molitor]
MEKDLRTTNEEFLKNFNKSFRTFRALTNNLPRKPTNGQLILKNDLHFFPYRVSVVHEIKPLDN